MEKYITVVAKNGKRYKLTKQEFIQYITNINKRAKAIKQAREDFLQDKK